ncbi:hypothetical protein rosag_03020 [Roseisolibacter agri]|uniref:histidine kinase n=2 Tax=Roseisolibacter agri TaxID=2014610 RepID=A0AA37VDJ8_9BACT|nr:hypothetical protein rosag_03020 [Roseisolibacter agri]
MPGINLLLAADPPRFTMLAASDERLAATLSTREATIGRPLFEVFSDSNPENGRPSGVTNLRASLETVLRTRLPHEMEVQRYDLRRPDGTWEVRHWAPRNVPILGPDGEVRYLLHHVEDVTEAVLGAAAHDRLRGDYAESQDARQELEGANAGLLEQQLELELANQQLLEQSAELELQAEELRATAAELEARTMEAERARAEADAASRRLAFLADASERLAASLDYETTLREVLALAVPMIADWALYTVDAGDGTLRIVASRHVVPAKEAFIAETARRYPIRADEPAGAARVLRTGEPELIPLVPDAVLEQVARDPAHLALLRGVGFRSLMTVPVRVQGRTLGALGFVTGESGRLYAPEDLAFAQELARRAATALDQARLYADVDAARREAQASAVLARQLFALSPLPKWVYDVETLAFLDVNEAAVRHYGWSREEFLAMTIRDVRPPDEVPPMLAVAQAAHPMGGSQGVFHHRRKSGEVIDVEVFLRDVPYGGRRAVIAVLQDVTARRRADAALREASQAAAAARDAAEAANAAKSQFLSTMSHELRTPLNAIGGYTELLSLGLRGPLTDAQRQDLERVRLANQHLMSLVTDILNFTRIDAGQIEFRPADVELATVVTELESLIGPQLAAKGIAFDHDACGPDTPDQPHVVRADPEKLRQILLNLLSNAVKFTESGGRVAIACATDGDAKVTRVRVSDTGRGIPPEEHERIFEPFVQVDRHRTHESQQGVGLGLAISRELARGMGGDLTVESTAGAGSTFTLTLPRP